MMSPITVRAEVDAASEVSDSTETVAVQKKFEEATGVATPVEAEVKTLKVVHRQRSGAAKLDAALQALNDNHASNRGVNHKPPHTDDEVTTKRESRRNNSKNSNAGRSSEESVRSNGRKSGDGGSRRSHEGSSRRKSNESQRSTTTDMAQQDDNSDQLSQITDILLARLITTLSDSTLGNPALLLQTLLGFSPDDYNDLLAALSESRLSYVDIISAYLHNIRVMSEDSGSTSAALSGTLTRSLIEQYNSLLAQAVKSPQNIARVSMVGDQEGRSHLADLLKKASTGESKTERRSSFEGLLPKGPSGLGFGRRHAVDPNKQRQQQQAVSQTLLQTDSKPVTQGMPENTMIDFAKMFANSTVGGTSSNVSIPSQGGNGLAGLTQEQFATFLQSAGLMATNGATPYAQQQHTAPSLPFLPNTVGTNVNGMLAMNMVQHPYMQHQMQPFAVPMQQMAGTTATGASSRNGMSWQGPSTVGFQQPANVYRGWGGAGLETVHENFNTHHLPQPEAPPPLFPQAINMQQQHGQHPTEKKEYRR